MPCEWAVPTPVVPRRRKSIVQDVVDAGTVTVAENVVQVPPSMDLGIIEAPPLSGLQALFTMPDPILSFSNPITSEQRFLLTYYIHNLVPTFSVVATSTAYHLSLYIPMAFQSIGVLNAILACAASHLAKTLEDEFRAAHFTQMATVHQMMCHEYLQSCIYNETSEARNSDETIAVLMLLVALETHNGSKGEKWQKQLRCAGKIVAARGGPRHFIEAGWESQSVFGHFLYHDCCSMIMNGVLADLDESFGISQPVPDWTSMCPEDSLNVDLISEVDPLMGLASSLFMKIRRISRVKDLPVRSLERNDLFLTLEREIKEWCVQTEHGTSRMVKDLDLAVHLDLIALAETYRLGAMILLYRTSDLHSSVLPKIAKQIMSFVARIPDGNQVESGLGFPLFMAGGELVDLIDMQACANKLRGIRDRTKIMNIQGVEEVLERVWKGKLNGMRIDWIDVLREEQRVICVA